MPENVSSIIKEVGLKIIKELNNQYEISINEESEAQRLLKELISRNIIVEKIEIKKPSLNDIFIEKVGDK